MADLALIHRDTIHEDSTYTARWRFVDATRTPYNSGDATSWKYDAYQLEPYSSTALADDTALAESANDSTPNVGQIGVFDTEQTETNDAGWEDDDDSTGYNCITTFPATLFGTPGKVRIEVYAVISSTTIRAATFEVSVLAAYGS